MLKLPNSQLEAYRAGTYQINPTDRVKDIDSAVCFVKKRGFTFFWPIKDTLLPSLWVATAGDRPVPNNHDDPGHVTWGWKDSLLGKKRWYYAKILRKKATLISLDVLPYFYALSQNYGSPEEDHLILYEQGLLSSEAKAIYDAVLDNGPLDTISLRKAAHLSSSKSTSRFNRALTELQADFKLMPIGVAQAGAWRYAFIYDIVARYHPEILEQARFIGESDASQYLAKLYFRSVGAASASNVTRLFSWRRKQVNSLLQSLLSQDFLTENVLIPNQEEPHYALSSFF